MRKPSVGMAHILNVNVRKNFVDVNMQEEMGHFFEGNIEFFTFILSITIIPAVFAATNYYLYVAYGSRSLSITHATVMVITRVM